MKTCHCGSIPSILNVSPVESIIECSCNKKYTFKIINNELGDLFDHITFTKRTLEEIWNTHKDQPLFISKELIIALYKVFKIEAKYLDYSIPIKYKDLLNIIPEPFLSLINIYFEKEAELDKDFELTFDKVCNFLQINHTVIHKLTEIIHYIDQYKVKYIVYSPYQTSYTIAAIQEIESIYNYYILLKQP